MKQSLRTLRTVRSIGVMVLGGTLAFGAIWTSHVYGPRADGDTVKTQEHTYPGPSHDYAATPHPWSLSYAGPDSGYYARDVTLYRRWEQEVAKDGPSAAQAWALIGGITIVAKSASR